MDSEISAELVEHRTAVDLVNADLAKVPTLGFASSAVLATVINTLRVASARDPRRLNERERDALIGAIGEAHAALMKLQPDPAQASSLTIACNILGTLVLAWAGDPRWTVGSGPFGVVQRLALAQQLEFISTAIIDDIAAEQERLAAGRANIIERLLTAGRLEN